MLHHVDVELVGVAVAVAALGALVLGRVSLVLVVQQALCVDTVMIKISTG